MFNVLPHPRDFSQLMRLNTVREQASFSNGFAMYNADCWGGGVFRALYSENMTGVRVLTGNNVGTQTGILTAELYAVDSNGHPTGSLLATKTGVTSSSRTWLNIVWDTPYMLTAGTCYAVVLKNTSADPANNYFRIGGDVSSGVDYRLPKGFFLSLYTITGGTNWNHTYTHTLEMCMAPVYETSGTPAPMMTSWDQITTGLAMYNTSGSRIARHGVKYNCPVPFNLWAVVAGVGGRTGSPDFNLVAEICSATASLTTSTSSKVVSSTGTNTYWFNESFLLEANTDYYIVFRPRELDNSEVTMDGSNYIRMNTGTCFQENPALGIFKWSVQSTAVNPSFSYTQYLPHIDLLVESIPNVSLTMKF